MEVAIESSHTKLLTDSSIYTDDNLTKRVVEAAVHLSMLHIAYVNRAMMALRRGRSLYLPSRTSSESAYTLSPAAVTLAVTAVVSHVEAVESLVEEWRRRRRLCR